MRLWMCIPLLLVGCAHNNGDVKSAANNGAGNGALAQAGNGEKTCNSDSDCGDKQLCVRNRCVDIDSNLQECSLARIHFDYDKADLRDDERPAVERMSRCLKADQAMHVTIEGNADERGTDEYNMALGDKRANTVEKYLERLGVSDRQLKAVSYGKERPLCTEHSEDCWSQNRRAALRPTASR